MVQLLRIGLTLILALAVIITHAPEAGSAATLRARLNAHTLNDDGNDGVSLFIQEISGVQGKADVYVAIALPAGEILAFDGRQWAPVWDGSQVLTGNLRPIWQDVELPLPDDTFTLVEGILPAGVPLGQYTFYTLVARAGTFAGDPANWLFPVHVESFVVVGPLPIAPFTVAGAVAIDQVRLRGVFVCCSATTISVGCQIEMAARNLTQNFVTIEVLFNVFDAHGNGLGIGVAGGRLNGSQAKILSGVAPATPFPNGVPGADCSGIGTIQRF